MYEKFPGLKLTSLKGYVCHELKLELFLNIEESKNRQEGCDCPAKLSVVWDTQYREVNDSHTCGRSYERI